MQDPRCRRATDKLPFRSVWIVKCNRSRTNAAVSRNRQESSGLVFGSPHIPERRHQPKNQRMIKEWPSHGMEGSGQQYVACMMFFPIAVQGSAPLKGRGGKGKTSVLVNRDRWKHGLSVSQGARTRRFKHEDNPGEVSNGSNHQHMKNSQKSGPILSFQKMCR